MTKIGENVYYNKYTSQIEEELNKNGKMKLKRRRYGFSNS